MQIISMLNEVFKFKFYVGILSIIGLENLDKTRAGVSIDYICAFDVL